MVELAYTTDLRSVARKGLRVRLPPQAPNNIQLMNPVVELLQKLPVWLLLILSASSVIAGDFFAKYWSIHLRSVFYFLAIASYMLSGFFYIPTLLREGLIVTSVIWSVLSIVGFLVIGLLIFKETLSTVEIVGVLFGVISLVILSISK